MSSVEGAINGWCSSGSQRCRGASEVLGAAF